MPGATLSAPTKPAGGLYDGVDFAGGLPLGPDWTQNDYADGAWAQGNGAIGFDTAAAGTEYHPQLGTNLTAQMFNIAWSVYMRREFTLTQAQFDALTGHLADCRLGRWLCAVPQRL
jgi:hypothetical protein